MIVSNEISNAYTEVLEILNYLDKHDYEKIPKEKIALYEQLKNNTYSFKFNQELSIDQQVSNKAKIIIANIFYNYIATKEEKKIIQKKDMEELKKEEEEKKHIKLNPLFENDTHSRKNHNIDNTQDFQQSQSTDRLSMVVVNNTNFFQKIINKLKLLFKK